MDDILSTLCELLEEEYGFDSDDLFINQRYNRVVIESDVDVDELEGIEDFGVTISGRRDYDGYPCLKVFDKGKLEDRREGGS